MKGRMVGILGALLAVGLLVWAFVPRPPEVEVGTVTTGRFERSVREEGKTRLRQRYVVSAPVAGNLSRITLRPGDVVTRGQVIATLTPTAPALLDERARQEQRERVGAMTANARRAATNVERARSALAQASADLKRVETLASKGFVAPTQGESARFTVDFRRRELEAAQLEEHAVRHELEQLRVALEDPRSGSGPRPQHSVTAPVAGRVLKVVRDSEGAVAAGSALIEIGDPTQLEVIADLLTEEAALLQPGAVARLTNWGGPEVLEGRVRLVEPAAFTKVSALGVEEQRVRVVLDLVSPAARWQALGDGFKVEVGIVAQAVDAALLAPLAALFPQGPRHGVLVVEGGRVRLVPVEVLGRNGQVAWLRSDLPAGTRLVLYPPAGLGDGARVTVLTVGQR